MANCLSFVYPENWKRNVASKVADTAYRDAILHFRTLDSPHYLPNNNMLSKDESSTASRGWLKSKPINVTPRPLLVINLGLCKSHSPGQRYETGLSLFPSLCYYPSPTLWPHWATKLTNSFTSYLLLHKNINAFVSCQWSWVLCHSQTKASWLKWNLTDRAEVYRLLHKI